MDYMGADDRLSGAKYGICGAEPGGGPFELRSVLAGLRIGRVGKILDADPRAIRAYSIAIGETRPGGTPVGGIQPPGFHVAAPGPRGMSTAAEAG